MNAIYVSRQSIGKVKFSEGSSFSFLVISKRTANFIFKQSKKGKWLNHAVMYDEIFELDGLLLVGFQMVTGRHIAIVKKEKGMHWDGKRWSLRWNKPTLNK